MNLRETMQRAADEEQLRLKPLPKHIIAPQPKHLRLHYALLLAALLSAQEAISEQQSRLMHMLLDAIELGDIRGALFEQARELDEKKPVEAARLIRDAGLARHLLVDALILLRLDAPFDDNMAGLVSELASFLDVDAENLETCVHAATKILGLGKTRSDASAKRWPGVFDGIGKPDAPVPASTPRAAAKKTIPPENKRGATTPKTQRISVSKWPFPVKSGTP